MKSTFFLVTISLLLLGSCSNLTSSKKIKIFEQTLGKENSKALTNYVNAFENQVLKKRYPSLTTDRAYAKLLSEKPYSIAPMKLYESFTDYNLDEYFNSQLWHEIYAPVDSIWIEKFQLNSRFVYLSEEGKKEAGSRSGLNVKGMDKDSIIAQELKVCFFNNQGKYWQAIESIKDDVPFLEEFHSAKTRMSHIGIGHFSALVHRNKLDLNDYLVRRIIAVELSKFINDARDPKKNTFANN